MLISCKLTAIINWLVLQLTKQKKNDFKPRNDDQSFARVNTEPCVACCETLERVRDAAKENLSGKNLEVFLTEVGVSFHGYAHALSITTTLPRVTYESLITAHCLITSRSSQSARRAG